MAIIERRQDLFESACCRTLVKIFLFDDTVEKFTTFANLSDQVHILLIFEKFIEFDDIGMVLHTKQEIAKKTQYWWSKQFVYEDKLLWSHLLCLLLWVYLPIFEGFWLQSRICPNSLSLISESTLSL